MCTILFTMYFAWPCSEIHSSCKDAGGLIFNCYLVRLDCHCNDQKMFFRPSLDSYVQYEGYANFTF